MKNRLGITYLRAHGDLGMECSKIGLLAGYRGGAQNALPLFDREQLDLIIYGEGPEGETPEYVSDAVFMNEQVPRQPVLFYL